MPSIRLNRIKKNGERLAQNKDFLNERQKCLPKGDFKNAFRHSADCNFHFYQSAWRRIQLFVFSPFGMAPNSVFCVFAFRRGAEFNFLRFRLSAWRRIQFFCVFAFRRGAEFNFLRFRLSAWRRLQFFQFSPFGATPIAVFSVFVFRRDADCSFCFHLSARNSRTELTADFCKQKNSASCPQTISSNGMIPRAEFDRFPAVEKFRELSARAFMKHCYDTQVIPNSKTFVLAFFSESAIKKHKNLKRI